MPHTRSLPVQRAAVGRAARAVKRSPNDANRAALAAARRDLAELKIADYVTRVVADAPPLRPEQLDRLAQLVRPDATRSDSAA